MRSFAENSFLALSLTGFLATAPGMLATEHPPANGTPVSRLDALLGLDPFSDASLEELARGAETLIATAKQQEKERKTARKEVRDNPGLGKLSSAALREYFHEPPGQLSQREVRALAELSRLAQAALESRTPPEREACVADLLEVRAALRNDLRTPVPQKLGFATPFQFFFSDWRRTVGRGTTLASNLTLSTGVEDLSRLDPVPSSFWQRPTNIASQNLYAGFGRERLASLEDAICRYDGPKTSFGTKAGFDVECDGRRFQIKFGEVNSEPFTARIFHALGYHVDPTDYSARLKIRYDRRLFREFHLRKPLQMRIQPWGIPHGSIELQPRHDPFHFVVAAVFKDGRQVSGAKLKRMLFTDPEGDEPEDSPQNFSDDTEATLDYLILAAANVQPKDLPADNLGPWDFGGLGHEGRRELRGVALLAAWLEWSDSRSDNTRLRVARTADHAELQHFFSDLGAGMGDTSGWVSLHGEDPNQLHWTFTRAEIVRGPGRMTTPFRVVHFHPIVATPAFREMTVDDARWMALMIGQLSEEQIRAALIASGYDAAEVKLYQEKLVSRRDQMVRDLKLTGEVPLLRTNAPDREFSYDPSVDGSIGVKLASGETVNARSSRKTVKRGRLTSGAGNKSSRRASD